MTAKTLPNATTFEIPDHVIARTVGEETVILDLNGGTYFGLDPVGARIWGLIENGLDLGAVRENMLAEFEVSAEQLDQDLAALIGQLVERQLLLPESEGA